MTNNPRPAPGPTAKPQEAQIVCHTQSIVLHCDGMRFLFITLALSVAHAFDPGHALSQHKRHKQHTIAKEQHTAAFGRKQGVAVGPSDTAGAGSASRKRGWNPFPGEVTDANYVPPDQCRCGHLCQIVAWNWQSWPWA